MEKFEFCTTKEIKITLLQALFLTLPHNVSKFGFTETYWYMHLISITNLGLASL